MLIKFWPLALYPVREQKFGKRLKLLKEYMRRIHNTFPDFGEIWRYYLMGCMMVEMKNIKHYR